MHHVTFLTTTYPPRPDLAANYTLFRFRLCLIKLLIQSCYIIPCFTLAWLPAASYKGSRVYIQEELGCQCLLRRVVKIRITSSGKAADMQL